MPSVKIPKKSTAVDMTPFVDVAFLILTFFIMATKFKPQEPVEIKTPNSVSTVALPESDALQVTFDSTGRVFFSVLSEKDPKAKYEVIKQINTSQNLGLTELEMKNFVQTPSIGVPFASLKQLLDLPVENQKDYHQPGVPLDTLGGQLYTWIRESVGVFTGSKLQFLIKGDNQAKYPAFKMVLNAFKKNDIFKFKMITMLEDVPKGTELYALRSQQKADSK